MDINPEDETSYTTHYQEACLKYVGNECCAKHQPMSGVKPDNVPHSIIPPSAKASGFGQLHFDPHDLSSDDEESITPESVAETTPRQSDCPAHILTAAKLN